MRAKAKGWRGGRALRDTDSVFQCRVPAWPVCVGLGPGRLVLPDRCWDGCSRPNRRSQLQSVAVARSARNPKS